MAKTDSTERRRSGVGALGNVDAQWERVPTECSAHICGKRVALGVVDMWIGKGAEGENRELFECVTQDVETVSLPCIVVGDFNAHIGSLDKAMNRAGRRLLDWVATTRLAIVNTTEKCKGRTT